MPRAPGPAVKVICLVLCARVSLVDWTSEPWRISDVCPMTSLPFSPTKANFCDCRCASKRASGERFRPRSELPAEPSDGVMLYVEKKNLVKQFSIKEHMCFGTYILSLYKP